MTAAREIISLPFASIAPGEHVGLVDDAFVACLAARLSAEGQTTPIWVRRNGNRAATAWTLVAGRHRVQAATSLGWTHIDALQVADEHDGPIAAERLQLAENLDRRVMRPIERAIFIERRANHEERRAHPEHFNERSQDRAARARWIGRNGTDVDAADIVSAASQTAEKWQEQVAKACGCTERNVRRYRAIYRGIVVRLPDLYADLNAHPAADSLSGIASIAELPKVDDARKVAELLLADRRLAITQALVAAGLHNSNGNRELPEPRTSAHVLSLIRKMPSRDRRGIVAEIATFVGKREMDEALAVWRKRGMLS